MPLNRVIKNIQSSIVNRPMFDPTSINRMVERRIDRSVNLSRNIGKATGASLGAPVRVGSAAGSGLLSGVKNQFPNKQMPTTMNNSKESRGILDNIGVGGAITFGANKGVPLPVWIAGGVALVAVGFGIFTRLNQPKRKRR